MQFTASLNKHKEVYNRLWTNNSKLRFVDEPQMEFLFFFKESMGFPNKEC